MPGLLPNTLSGLSATPSSSRAPERGPFPKPFTDRTPHTDDGHPSVAKAMHLLHMPAPQAMRVQSRLNPVSEVAKIGFCATDRRTSMERMTSACCVSGSDHDPSSVCLVAMVNEFMESDSACTDRADSCNSLEGSMFHGLADISNSLESLARCRDDLEIKLLRDVQAIVESSEEHHQSGCARTDRKHLVMSSLQRVGYDAAMCKTRWDRSNGISGGDYEYIDVLFALNSPAEPLRLLVDIEFQAQFEIARPSREFSAILQLVPSIFVGRPERLQQIVHVMAEATKQSLCVKSLHLPPWRKLNYMKAKWFSSYKRTSNSVASSSRKQADDSVNGRGFSGIDVREYGMDPWCTNELKTLYHGSKPLSGGSKDAISRSNARDELITVTITNWQPPPLEVRSHSRTRLQSSITGLASMLPHTDLPTCNKVAAKAA